MNIEHVKIFEDLMSPDKDTRTRAEEKIQECKALPLQDSLQVFAAGMSATNPNISQLATLMLKKTYLDDKNILAVLKPDEVEYIKSLLGHFIIFEGKEWKSLQRIADALAKLYQISDLSKSFESILLWFANENALSRQFAIYLIEVLCELGSLKDEVVAPAVEDFKGMFLRGLSDPDVKVRVSTLKATTQFLTNLDNDELVMKFTPLLDSIMDSLIYALKNDETTGKMALETMNYLTDRHSKFWKEKLETFIDIICQISQGQGTFTNVIRESALELVYTLTKNTPALMRKSTNFNTKFIPLIFALLLELDNIDNISEWENAKEEEEIERDEMHYAIRDGIERLALDLGGKFFMEATAGYIKKYLQSDNWLEIHAGFMALAQMAEGCKEIFEVNIIELLNYISNGLAHTHPRVRYSALTALGMILDENAPKVQKEYHANILPALAVLMSEKETVLRVKTQSCSALVDFLRGLVIRNSKNEDENIEIMKAYTDDLIKLLSYLFEASLGINYAPLQEETLVSMSLLATLLDKEFAPYYDVIMPGLKKLFYNIVPRNHEQEKLKSNAIETIAYLCSSVSENAEKYLPDLKEISEAFWKYLLTLKEEDPQVLAILNAFTHISVSMSKEFYPYLEALIPILEKYIVADIGLKIEDADLKEYIPEDEEEETHGKIGSVVLSTGSKSTKLSLNTFALQNKIMGINVLNEICYNMRTSFFPYVEKFLLLSKPLLKFPFSRKIRKIAIKSVYSCMNACNNDDERKRIIEFMSPELLGVFAYNVKAGYLHEIKAYLKVFTNITALITVKTTYTEEFIVQVYQILSEIIKFVNSRVTTLYEMKNDDVQDEMDNDDKVKDLDMLHETNRRVMEVSGILFKLFGDPLTELVVKSLYDSFLESWQKALTKTKLNCDQEVLNAICFFDDYMNYSNIVAFNLFYQAFLDLTLGYKTKNEDIIQSVIFGYGVICERLAQNEFLAVQDKILSAIFHIIQRTVTEANESTFDNAIGALGKYIYYQCKQDDNGIQVAGQFIKLLPLKYDLEEGKAVSIQFFKQIVANHPLIVDSRNLPLVKEAMGRIIELNKEEQFLEEEGNAGLVMACMALGISGQV